MALKQNGEQTMPGYFNPHDHAFIYGMVAGAALASPDLSLDAVIDKLVVLLVSNPDDILRDYPGVRDAYGFGREMSELDAEIDELHRRHGL